MCSIIDACIDYRLWPKVRTPARSFVVTHDVGGHECLMVTHSDPTCWVVYCHGNVVTLPQLNQSDVPTQIVQNCQCNFVAPNYPHKTTTGEQYDDAVVQAVQDVVEQLMQDSPRIPVYVVGRSVGTAIALRVSRNVKPAGIVLISGFASVRNFLPYPLRWLVPDRLNSLANIQCCQGVPKLIVHGTADQEVPIEHSKALLKLCPDAQPYNIDGMGHVMEFSDIQKLALRMKRFIAEHTSVAPADVNQTAVYYSLWQEK